MPDFSVGQLIYYKGTHVKFIKYEKNNRAEVVAVFPPCYENVGQHMSVPLSDVSENTPWENEANRLKDGLEFIKEQFDNKHKAYLYASWVLAGGDPRKIVKGQEEVPEACLRE